MHVDSTVLLNKDRPLSCISCGIVALLSVWGEVLCGPEMQLWGEKSTIGPGSVVWCSLSRKHHHQSSSFSLSICSQYSTISSLIICSHKQIPAVSALEFQFFYKWRVVNKGKTLWYSKCIFSVIKNTSSTVVPML